MLGDRDLDKVQLSVALGLSDLKVQAQQDFLPEVDVEDDGLVLNVDEESWVALTVCRVLHRPVCRLHLEMIETHSLLPVYYPRRESGGF